MTTINFISPKGQESEVLVKWRRIVKAVTTAVVVVWVVIGAGFLGWWVFMKSKTELVSNDLADLITQVAGKSAEEVVVRKLDLRVKAANDFLDNRGDILKKISTLTEATPEASAWKYERASDKHSVVIYTKTTAEVDTYLEQLKRSYKNVRIDSLMWGQDETFTGWTANISFNGLIK